MDTYLVRKPFQAGSRHLKPGDVVDASTFVHLEKLVDQRYLTKAEGEVPKPRAEAAPATVFVPTPAPTAKRRGRPRKVSAAEQPSE